ncbi:hypothetical protein ANO11243_077790 [Dothideomycetidae sp. 11243]|nr:hypothetical protein ANO11243_077790 [fungal sp. No.11243]
MGNSNGKPVVFTDEVNLDHFRLLRVVGKGAFGKVRIVERKDTGLTFALKYIRKDEAELGCALRYIHQQNVVHRDVKPDNVLLDSEGHVHLADFNVATDLTPGKPLTSKSGTLAYLAPEVYRGKGYGAEVDWWSLGVLFYECIYSKRPFEGNHHEQLAAAIMKGEPNYPVTNPPVSMVCLHAISSCLEKDRTLRIGASSWESFIDNPFFRELDFEMLERKEIEPVFRPSSEKTNFDATYDLEELLLEEAPLEARTRKQKPRAELRPDASEQEIRADELHRMIETMFEPFNYTTLPESRNPVTADAVGADTVVSADGTEARRDLSQINDPRSPGAESSRQQQGPISRSQTPRARSPTGSPSGSPPIPSSMPTPGGQVEYFSAADVKPQQPGAKMRARDTSAGPGRKTRGSTRTTSASGSGVQVTLNETGSWSDMANQSQAMVQEDGRKSSSMLGFLRSKKGRDKSPKARERGVIGKEGARVIVGG